MDVASPPLSFDVADDAPVEHPGYDALNRHLDALGDDLHRLSSSIHSAAEVCYRERRTHDFIADYMSKQDGWKVGRGPQYTLPTCIECSFEHRRGGRR
jgi:metal-dependent amidase/aminoacylase/carboxypeptidase family protein